MSQIEGCSRCSRYRERESMRGAYMLGQLNKMVGCFVSNIRSIQDEMRIQETEIMDLQRQIYEMRFPESIAIDDDKVKKCTAVAGLLRFEQTFEKGEKKKRIRISDDGPPLQCLSQGYDRQLIQSRKSCDLQTRKGSGLGSQQTERRKDHRRYEPKLSEWSNADDTDWRRREIGRI